jgi:hypothetical protein
MFLSKAYPAYQHNNQYQDTSRHLHRQGKNRIDSRVAQIHSAVEITEFAIPPVVALDTLR